MYPNDRMIFTALFRGGLTQSSVTPPDPVVWVVILRLIHRHARLTQVRTSGDHPPVIALVVNNSCVCTIDVDTDINPSIPT